MKELRIKNKFIIVTIVLGLILSSAALVMAQPSSQGLENGVNHQLETALQKIAELTSENNRLESEVSKLQVDNAQLNQAITALESNNTNLTHDINKLIEDNELISVENNNLIKEINILLEENQQLLTDNNTLFNEIDELKQQVRPTSYDVYQEIGLWKFEGYKTIDGNPDKWGRITTYYYALFSKDGEEVYILAHNTPFVSRTYYLAGIPGNSSGVFEVYTIETDSENKEFIKKWVNYPVNGATLEELQTLPLEQ